jgi:hypothetical protein
MSEEITTFTINQNELELVDTTMFEGESSGFEGTSSETFKTPFLKILQALSPEIDEGNSKYIPGAKIGMFCNSATQQLYNKIEVVILKVEHSLIVWKPKRGGFAGRYNKSKEDEIVSKRQGVKKWDTEGNEVDDTIELFCMNIKDPLDLFILSLSRTSFKHGRTFATRLRNLKANGKRIDASWAGIWEISLVKESNEEGSWFTIGSTPKFQRFISKEEKEQYITPARKILESAEIDYSMVEGESNELGDEDETF